MFNSKHILSIGMLATTCIALSCKKTEYQYEKRPYNDIRQFVVIGPNGDSTKSFISGDSITIYWSPDVALPASISPRIVIDDKATISPASGATVAFNKSTVYTVTAEDGSVKTYHLNPIVSLPFPSISNNSGTAAWLLTTQLGLLGEHFLTGVTVAEVKVYMQRAKDGFEVPLTTVANRTSNYSVTVNMPEFSAEQDTGLHKIYVQSGNRVSEPANYRFTTPWISYANPTTSLVQDGQPVHSGDSLTINYAFNDAYKGKVASYYHARAIDYILMYFSSGDTINIRGDRRYTDDMVRVKLPNIDKHIGQTLIQYRFIYKSVPAENAISSLYFLRGFMASSTPVQAKP